MEAKVNQPISALRSSLRTGKRYFRILTKAFNRAHSNFVNFFRTLMQTFDADISDRTTESLSLAIYQLIKFAQVSRSDSIKALKQAVERVRGDGAAARNSLH